MADYKEIDGTYGSGKTPATIFVCENRDGSSWYVAEGSVNVNKTYDTIEDGVNIEELSDDDTSSASKPINSLDDLEKFMDDEEYGKGGKAGGKKDLPTWEYTSGMEWSPNQVLAEFREQADKKFGKKLDHDDEVMLMTEAKEYAKASHIEVDDIIKMLEEYLPVSEMEKGGKVTSESLLEKLKAGDKIAENEVNLIKNRMNAGKEDEKSKELVQWIWDNNPELTPEQNKKGVDFLKNLWKSPTGKVRSSNPFGNREEQALETFEHFTLDGFHDISRGGGRAFNVPIYGVYGSGGNFQYYYDSEGVHIIGAKGGKMGKGEKDKQGTPKEIKKRLEELRKELRAERISQGELYELQSLAEYIDPSDVELLEPAGVPEFVEEGDEVEVVSGANAGVTGHITTIDEGSPFHITIKTEKGHILHGLSKNQLRTLSSGSSMATGGEISSARVKSKLIGKTITYTPPTWQKENLGVQDFIISDVVYKKNGSTTLWDYTLHFSNAPNTAIILSKPEMMHLINDGEVELHYIGQGSHIKLKSASSGGSMATGGEAGAGNVKDLFGKLKSYLDSTYQSIGNPQLAISNFMTEQSASMDAGAKGLFEKLGMDLGTTYSTIEVPSMAVDKWAIENKIELGKGGNVKSNSVNNFWNSFSDDGALIFGGSYFKSTPTEKKGLGGLLIGLGLGAGAGYVYRDAITKKKEQAKWSVMEAVDRLGKGGKAGDTDLTASEKKEVKAHLVSAGVKEESAGKIIDMLNDVRSGKRYMGDTIADTDVSIGDIMESLKLNDYVPAEVMAQGGSASGRARDRKYTSQEEHELKYAGKRKSEILQYNKHEKGGKAGGEVDKIASKFKPVVEKYEGDAKKGYSVLVKDKNSDFSAWVDVHISDNDVVSDWNKYIFHLNDAKDVKQKSLQENTDIFESATSEAIDYLEKKDAIHQGEKGWGYGKKLATGGEASGIARDRKYTSQQEHELGYKPNRKSRVRYYKKGD